MPEFFVKNHDGEDFVELSSKSSPSFSRRPSLTYHERYELSLRIATLPPDSRQEILNLINQEYKSKRLKNEALSGCPPCGAVEGGESGELIQEIDVDQLEDSILRKIQFVIRASLIEYKTLCFLITDTPKSHNLDSYVDLFLQMNVTHVVRTCDAEYSLAKLVDLYSQCAKNTANIGLQVFDWRYLDGAVPSEEIITEWLQLVFKVFPVSEFRKFSSSSSNFSTSPSLSSSSSSSALHRPPSKPAICIHCSAGLGRAPILVAIALVEYGMDAYECVDFIRAHRKGAINKRQLEFLLDYKPRGISKKNLFRFFMDLF